MEMATTAPRAKKLRRNREEQKADRTQELLESAWAMFCEKGYEAVTIDHVAEHAGYSRMPVYSLFGDKQNLFFELWRSKTGALLELMVADLKIGVPLRRNLEKLAKLVSTPTPTDKHGQGASLFFVAQTIALSRPDLNEKITQFARKVIETFAEMIRNSVLAKGEKLRADPETIAAHIVAHINGMSTVQFQTRGTYDTKARDVNAIFLAIALKNSGD